MPSWDNDPVVAAPVAPWEADEPIQTGSWDRDAPAEPAAVGTLGGLAGSFRVGVKRAQQGADDLIIGRLARGVSRDEAEIDYLGRMLRGEPLGEPDVADDARATAYYAVQRFAGATPEAIQARIGQLQQDTQVGRERMVRGVARRAEHEEAIRGIPVSEDMRAYQQARAQGDTSGALGVIATNPVEIPVNLMAQSLPASLPSITGGMAGALLAGPLGAAAGVFGGSATTEYAMAVSDTLAQQGIDAQDQGAVMAAFESPEFWAQARDRGLARGLVVGAADALTARMAGTFINAARQGGRSVVTAGLKETGMQMGGGAAGELGAQIATEGRITDPLAALEEAVAELPSAIVETGQNLMLRRQVAGQVIEQAGQQVADAQQSIQATVTESAQATTNALENPNVESLDDLGARQQEIADQSKATLQQSREATQQLQQGTAALQEASQAEAQANVQLAALGEVAATLSQPDALPGGIQDTATIGVPGAEQGTVDRAPVLREAVGPVPMLPDLPEVSPEVPMAVGELLPPSSPAEAPISQTLPELPPRAQLAPAGQETAQAGLPVQARGVLSESISEPVQPERFWMEQQVPESGPIEIRPIASERGQELWAFRAGQPVGMVRYSVQNGQLVPDIVQVNQNVRRQGIASELYRAMQAANPGLPVAPGARQTEEGSAFRQAFDQGVAPADQQIRTGTQLPARGETVSLDDYEAIEREAARQSGTPPTGTGGPVAVPEPPNESQGVRNLARRVITDEAQPEGVRRELAENPQIFYDKFSNGALMEATRNAPDAELSRMRESGDERVRAMALIEQANRASERGQDSEAASLYAEASTLFTGSAQLLNVAKAVRNPLGISQMIQRKVESTGRTLTQDQKKKLDDLSKVVVKAERDLEQSEQRARDDFSLQNERDYINKRLKKGNADRNLKEFVHELTPFSWPDLLIMALQGNLLTPLSIGANIFGNLAWFPVRRSGKSIASALDWGYANLTGNKRTVRATLPIPGAIEIQAGWAGLKIATRELLTGPSEESYVKQEVQRGFRPLRAWVQAWTGENLPRDSRGRVALNDRFKKMFEGTVGIPAEIMFRFLSIGDKPFRRAAEAETLVEGARLQNLTGREFRKALRFPDEATRGKLETESRTAIFAQENAFSDMLQYMDRKLGSIPRAGGALRVLGRMIAPYRQFPVNFVMTAMDFALPEIGMGRAILRAMEGDRRGALTSLGTAVVGALIYGAARFLWENGLLSEPPDEENKKRRSVQFVQMGPSRLNISGLKRKMAGEDPAWRLGDATVDWSKMGIPAAIFHIYAVGESRKDVIEIRRGKGSQDRDFLSQYAEDRLSAFPGMGSFVMNQSFLAGANAFLEALQDTSPDSSKTNYWFANMFRVVSSIPIPNTVEAVARTQYEYIPELRGDTIEESVKNIWDYKTFSLPQDSTTVLKRGLFGEPIQRTPDGSNRYIYNLFDVLKTQQRPPDPFKQTLIELFQETGLDDVYPTPPERDVTQNGVTVRLTPKDHENLQAFVGHYRLQYAKEFVAGEQFKQADPIERVIGLKALYEAVGTGAKQRFMEEPAIQQRYFGEAQDRVRGRSLPARLNQ